MPQYRIEVMFHAPPVTVEVNAPSMKTAWEDRYDLVADVVPEEFETRPTSIEAVDDDLPSRAGGERG